MRRVVLLALLALALPIAAAADTFDYANAGTVSGGTAILSGSATNGGSLSLTSALTAVVDTTTNANVCGNGGAACNGWVSVTTGSLSSCSSGLCFTGGTLSITDNGKTVFSGTFSGTVTVANGFVIVNGTVGGVAGSTQIVFKLGSSAGTISGDTIVTPEPGTLGLLGTGLLGLAGIVRRKLRG